MLTIVRGVPGDVAAVEAGTPLGCAATWFYDNQVERGIKHCVIEWAATHPEAGYPPNLRAVGPEGTGCLELIGAPLSADVVAGFESGSEYRAAEPDGCPRRGARLHAATEGAGASGEMSRAEPLKLERWLDSTGAWWSCRREGGSPRPRSSSSTASASGGRRAGVRPERLGLYVNVRPAA
jgi:hypothetical protein